MQRVQQLTLFEKRSSPYRQRASVAAALALLSAGARSPCASTTPMGALLRACDDELFPLHAAVAEGRESRVTELLAGGAAVDALDSAGFTALDIAIGAVARVATRECATLGRSEWDEGPPLTERDGDGDHVYGDGSGGGRAQRILALACATAAGEAPRAAVGIVVAILSAGGRLKGIANRNFDYAALPHTVQQVLRVFERSVCDEFLDRNMQQWQEEGYGDYDYNDLY